MVDGVMAVQRLVVMEGGHPWGFRIEGGDEVHQPIRINKVLVGGKADIHRIQVGDVVNGINGENARNMTISHARHLIRASENILVLEIARIRKEPLRTPENRVTSQTQLSDGRRVMNPTQLTESKRVMSPTQLSNDRRVMSPTQLSNGRTVMGVAQLTEGRRVMSPTQLNDSRSGMSLASLTEGRRVMSPTQLSNDRRVMSPTQLSSSRNVTSPTQLMEDRRVMNPTQLSSSRSVTSPTQQIESRRVMSPTQLMDDRRVMSPTQLSNDRSVTSPTQLTDGKRVMSPTQQMEGKRVMSPTQLTDDRRVMSPAQLSNDRRVMSPTQLTDGKRVMSPTQLTDGKRVMSPTQLIEDRRVMSPTQLSNDRRVMSPTQLSNDRRVMSPTLLTDGRRLHWAEDEVFEAEKNTIIKDKLFKPVPPPKPPLILRSPLSDLISQKANHLPSPVSPSPGTDNRRLSSSSSSNISSSSPAVVLTPPGIAIVVDGCEPNRQSKPAWQNTRPSSAMRHNFNSPGSWTFTVTGPHLSSQKSGISSQQRNTEPAPIKPEGLGGPQRTGISDKRPTTFAKPETVSVRNFRQRTTDAGTMDSSSLANASFILPPSSNFKTVVSGNRMEARNRQSVDGGYDLLPNQQQKIFNLQGLNRRSLVFQNSYNDRKLGSASTVPRLEKSWPMKIQDLEAGHYSSTSSSDPTMEDADYDYLPSQKPLSQHNTDLSPKEQSRAWGVRTVKQDQFLVPDQRVFPGRQRSGGVMTRQKLDEDNLRRKLEIERVIAEEKRRRYLKEQIANNARRHSDNFTPAQKRSSIMDRFSDDEIAEALARPMRRVATKVRGKARALYTFRAQNSRELGFRRNDVVYILRQVDKNWFEGERHGMVGIFPISYVQVITSLDEAKATAILREGTATALYNFRAQSEAELALKKGELVTLIRRVDENWYEGRLGRRQGIFPINYVETHREPDTPMATPMPSLASTPVPGTPACSSPVGSIFSAGPEIPSAPMSPLDSEFYESDWDVESLGALQTGRPLQSSRPTSPSHSQVSDRDITPVRAVTSPVQSQISDRDITPVRAVTSPIQSSISDRDITPVQSFTSRIQSPLSDQDIMPIRSVTSSSQNGVSDHHITPAKVVDSPIQIHVSNHDAKSVTAPVPTTIDGPKPQNSDVQLQTINSTMKTESKSDVKTNSKETSVKSEQSQRKNSVETAESSSKSEAAAKQRPPSGRPPLQSPKTLKQKPPPAAKPQLSVDGRDRRDGFSKSTRLPNPYTRYRVVHNYKPQNVDELELIRGDIVYVIEKCSDGWYVGISDKMKQFGTFPGNFVRPM